ncbi:MAG: DUF2156 domain-containing protein [Oscillospiraceae bacterium]|nr:DUF2156 domain-containing protein [Oscillospiraceae bacterium]
MLDFRPLSPEDAAWLRPVLRDTENLSCDYSPACMVMWGNASIAECGGFYVPMVTYNGRSLYLRPIGAGDFIKTLPALFDDSRERGIPFRMYGITPEVRAHLEETQTFIYTANRDNFDYLYSVEALASLAGRKLQSKRNHINRFEAETPDWSCRPISRENIPECEALITEWYREHYEKGADPASFDGERRAIATAFDHYETFGFDGLTLWTGDRLVAFSLGMPLNRTCYDVNFEKALSEMPGAYALINREFARLVQEKYPEIRYLNREDDLGSDGLRQAKLSYHPELLLEKYMASLPEDATCESQR